MCKTNLICVISPRRFNDGFCVHLFLGNLLIFISHYWCYVFDIDCVYTWTLSTLNNCVCVYEYMWMQLYMEARRVTGLPGYVVLGGSGLMNMGDGNWPLFLCVSKNHSLLLIHLSSLNSLNIRDFLLTLKKILLIAKWSYFEMILSNINNYLEIYENVYV